jgi:hypothetical protein
MKLLSPGDPPRRRLRYAWRPAQREQLAMDLRTAVSEETGADAATRIPMPGVRVVIALEPRSVSPEGDLHFAWRVTAATVLPAEAGAPQPLAQGLEAEVASLEHLSGTASVSARGLGSDVSIDGATSGPMVEQVREVLRDVAAPLPEDEVGQGARWQKLSQLAGRGARVTQTETFALAELDGDHGVLTDTLTQTAPAQDLRSPPGAPAGSGPHMDSMLASGEARTRFDLGRLVPQTTFRGTTTMTLSSASAGDDPRRVTMVTQVELSGSVP